MFGAFSPGDSLRVYRLQRKGVPFDLRRALTRSTNPLSEAYLALVTQQAMGQPTYVLYDSQEGEAFIQVRFRPHQAAADVALLAPSLGEHDLAGRAWMHLLEGACTKTAERGIQRVFANLPESGAEVEVFRQVGFAPYGAEDIYQRSVPVADPEPGNGLPLRRQKPEDWPALQKLCVAVTPQRMREAEGGISLAVQEGRDCQRYVLPGGSEDIVASLSLCTGSLANWMRVLVHPDVDSGTADALLRWALARFSGMSANPVYCNVGRHEGGIRGPLDAAGFAPYAGRTLMVKHTVAWSKVPLHELVPALQGGAELAPPAYRINGRQESPAPEGLLVAEPKA